MNKKSKRLLVFSLLLFLSIVVAALGLKYFPFTKVMKMPAASESDFVNPQKVRPLSPHSLFYDFEMAPGKEMPGGFYKGQAHSGQYSVKAFGQNSFSIAVERTAQEVGVENLKAVALSAWIYVFPTKNEVKGHFVFTASNELGVNVCWQGIGLREPEIPRGKWFKISGYFDLTSVAFKPGYKLQIYFWNNSRTDILIDDYNIVFGGAVDRRGDSAWVDMTRPAGYTPRFNYPPFPVSLLEKETIVSLPKPSEILPSDFVIAGNFLNTGSDALFIIGQDGKPASFAFCPETRGFRKVILNYPAATAPFTPVKKILKGKFLNIPGEQIIITGDKSWMMAALEPVGKPCTSSGPIQANLKILWKSETPATSLYAGDFTGDHRTELLMVADNGSWKVMSFEQTGNTEAKWKVVAEDDHDPVKEWNRSNQEISISTGRFFANTSNDQVLTTTKGNGTAKCTFFICKLNIVRMKWEPLFPEKQNYSGKTIGLDTLKQSDIFFAGNTGEGNDLRIFRYNRDWRFNLKEIRFNDTTFAILSSVDFHGFDLDHNPKYCESLVLIPGHFLSPSDLSFLAIGHIAKNRHYETILPDFTDIYSIPRKK